ncbi:hypothetical protein L6R52_00975 [Myxococcota bacterium]|nr:hypothetical protein [Myxococcota bacterium]
MSSTLLPLALAALIGAQTESSTAALPLGDAPLRAELDRLREQLKRELAADASRGGASWTSIFELKADAYIKWLYQNDTTQGCVAYGNPHPTGDRYSGNNGACPELGLTLLARPHPKIEGGFRIQSRYGMDFADWFENGDERDEPDASGESLGVDHAAMLQLRGIYVRVAEPVPFVDWVLAGSSDLGHWDAWTIGRIRYIDRFNAKGLFLKTSLGSFADLLVARVAMAKLFGAANYNSLEEALVTNPFWTRDAIYGVSLATKPRFIDGVTVTLNAGLSLDEEADVRDPDAPGSTNTTDERDLVTAVDSRFTGLNGTLTVDVDSWDWMRARLVVAASMNDVNPRLVTNLSKGGLGFSNVVFDDTADLAATLRVELPDLLSEGGTLRLEYFNIGADFNAIAGARREDDVLLTDGFLDGGQLPTLNLANELINFSDAFYESVIGWHGGTVVFDQEGAHYDLGAELTFIEYNTDLQDRDTDLYPTFGAFTGYTDTDLYSYANTNDRGRDPRAVYARHQARRTLIAVGRFGLKPLWWRGATIDLKAKLIRDTDLRDETTPLDDYAGTIVVANASVGWQALDTVTLTAGMKLDYWIEDGRSGTYSGGMPSFLDYTTKKLKPYVEGRYALGPLVATYHFEVVKKIVTTSDPSEDLESGLVVRSLGTLSAQF